MYLSSSSSSSSNSDEEHEVFEVLINLPRPRLYRDRFNPLEHYDDLDFKNRFRLTKNTFMILLNVIGKDIKHDTNRSYAIKPEVQLLIALRFYATGAFQTVIGDHIQVHKSSVCRIIKRVSKCIACLRPLFINMPKTQNELQEVQIGFYRRCQFPKVIGAIDCTHIKIQSPNSNIGEQFRNRKGYFSFNVQAVCNSKMEIMNIVARWPGSVHDSTIFDNSLLRAQFENNEFKGCFLLGDGGYPCRKYLMTPLLNPTTAAEKKYQNAQIGTRNVIERVFGVLKRRFPVLSVGLRIQPKSALITIVATAVLHNILLKQNDTMPQNDLQIDDELFEELDALPVQQVGNAVRNNLIENYFS
ncbi:putative nuclease HARBI1 [Metopolophium dirhodum]|uniref:putative nuclease HARBI1 n=1 Tax=Metopolophium dirhodum TaxID=44670 RepID=UPI00298F4FA7|nr:putative nuclease HARBI1 [Metopolophium dirhodum]